MSEEYEPGYEAPDSLGLDGIEELSSTEYDLAYDEPTGFEETDPSSGEKHHPYTGTPIND